MPKRRTNETDVFDTFKAYTHAQTSEPAKRKSTSQRKEPAVDVNGKRLRKGQFVELLSHIIKTSILGFSSEEIECGGQIVQICRVSSDGHVHFYLEGREDTNYLPCSQVKVVARPVKRKVAMDSVILPDEKKSAILAAISQRQNHDQIFSDWGFSGVLEKGTAVSLLFWGEPGTGKTLAAQAIADMFDADLKILGGAELYSSHFGESEKVIQKAFQEAESKNRNGLKQILLLDECDSILAPRDIVANADNIGQVMVSITNCLLTEIERFNGVIIFTTNRIYNLDQALERRISMKVEFPFPTQELREQIWRRMIPKKAPLHRDVDFAALAEIPIAGGNIKNAVLSAARNAAHSGQRKITHKNLADAAKVEVEARQKFRRESESQELKHLAEARLQDTQQAVERFINDLDTIKEWMPVKIVGGVN